MRTSGSWFPVAALLFLMVVSASETFGKMYSGYRYCVHPTTLDATTAARVTLVR